jgi:hypothetical protein
MLVFITIPPESAPPVHRPQRLICLFSGLLLLATTQGAVAQQAAPADGGRTIEPVLNGWRFHQVGKDNWAPAMAPGCVHTDMLTNKQIEDPLYRDNEMKLQWIGKTDWEYETTFAVAPTTLQRQHLELVFKGLNKKQSFNPGESRELTFTIQPQQDLTYPSAEGQRLLEDGNQKRRFRYAGVTAQAPTPRVLPPALHPSVSQIGLT